MSKQRKKQATLEENRIADRLGAWGTPNSGAGHEKGDSRLYGIWRVENKYTSKGQYSISYKDWDVLWRNATMAGETPLFVINMKNIYASGRLRLVVLPLHVARQWVDLDLGGSPCRSKTLSSKKWSTTGSFAFEFEKLHIKPRKGRMVAVMHWETFCKLAGVDDEES